MRMGLRFNPVARIAQTEGLWVISVTSGLLMMKRHIWDGSLVVRNDEELEPFTCFHWPLGISNLLRIMMLSVTKRTSGPVKFWLVENFLSPQFKMTIGQVAKEAGFEVALVTYKWPSWLRRQTEKQRIIWGYKILFLDVLFPLHVPKIITVALTKS